MKADIRKLAKFTSGQLEDTIVDETLYDSKRWNIVEIMPIFFEAVPNGQNSKGVDNGQYVIVGNQ